MTIVIATMAVLISTVALICSALALMYSSPSIERRLLAAKIDKMIFRGWL